MGTRVTIHDVARSAGVSTATVSNALSGNGRLSATTRDRVARIASELGYSASPSARGLRTRRVGAIGLYLPRHTVGFEYYMELAAGAAIEAMGHGLALTLIPAPDDGRVVRLHVDGVIVSDPIVGDPVLEHLTGLGVPLVTCERDLTPGAVHAGRVESDHCSATRELLDHLAGQGAGRIAVLCPSGETSFGLDIGRAYEEWSREAGRDPLLYEIPFASRPQDVQAAVDASLRAATPPDAIVSVTDGGAASTMHEVLREGLRVPEDLLVASYVDSRSLCGLTVPVTAVDLRPREMGARAAHLLADLVAGERSPGAVEVLPVELVVRASTSPSSAGTRDRDRPST